MFKLGKRSTLKVCSLYIVNSSGRKKKERNSLIDPLLNSAPCHSHSSFGSNYGVCTQVYGLLSAPQNGELCTMCILFQKQNGFLCSQ